MYKDGGTMVKDFFFKYQKWSSDKKTFKVKRDFFGYPLYKDNDYYQVFRHPIKRKKIVAAYDRMVIIQNNNKLIIYPNIAKKLYCLKLTLSSRHFPDLISNSRIDRVLIVPFIKTMDNGVFSCGQRIVVITNRGQIYHNYPMIEGRCKRQTESGMALFEESCIWDLPSAKYPSPNVDCDTTERFYPGLPQESYEYHPKVSEKSKKTFTFIENGKLVVLPRFYIHNRNDNSNPFHFIGSGELDYKMTLIGTYRSNTDFGVRVCLFATDDGGKNWFCKYEFSDFGDYPFRQGNVDNWGLNHGNNIKNIGYNHEYKENTIELFKRTLVFDKQGEMFNWVFVNQIKSFNNSNNISINFLKKHNLSNGNIVALKGAISGKNYDWMLNNNFDCNSNGNGMLFKVVVIDDYNVELTELVSQSNHNVCCRHIHHINRIKDGWLVGTGEIYPNGWLLYVQMKEADTYSVKKAYSDTSIIRLNGCKNSVQRTMGTILNGDDDPYLIYASDHDTLETSQHVNSFGFSRNSTGVFLGKLSNIDDRTKFNCVFNAMEPCFYFQKIRGKLVFCGQRGELATSFDNGKTWIEDRIDKCFYYYYGAAFDYHVFDEYVIKFKK